MGEVLLAILVILVVRFVASKLKDAQSQDIIRDAECFYVEKEDEEIGE